MGNLTSIIPRHWEDHKVFLHCYHIEQLSRFYELETQSESAIRTRTRRISDDDRNAIVEKFSAASIKSNQTLCLHYFKLLCELEKKCYSEIKGEILGQLKNMKIPNMCAL